MENFKFLTGNSASFQNLKWLEASKGNLATRVMSKEDAPCFEKLRYLEDLTLLKLNLKLDTLKYDDILLVLNSLKFPIALEKFHITLALVDITKEEGLDEHLANMLNQLSKAPRLTSMNIQIKVKGDYPSLKGLFTNLAPGFEKLSAFTYGMMGESPHKVELDKIFNWLSTLPMLSYLQIYVPKRDLSGFKNLKFKEDSFQRLTRFNVMTMIMDVLDSESFGYFLGYISQIKSIVFMQLNSWDVGFSGNDLLNLLTVLPNLQNLTELILSINGNLDELLRDGDFADMMKAMPKLRNYTLFIRTPEVDENTEEQLKTKFEPYKNAGRNPKLFINQVPVVV